MSQIHLTSRVFVCSTDLAERCINKTFTARQLVAQLRQLKYYFTESHFQISLIKIPEEDWSLLSINSKWMHHLHTPALPDSISDIHSTVLTRSINSLKANKHRITCTALYKSRVNHPAFIFGPHFVKIIHSPGSCLRWKYTVGNLFAYLLIFYSSTIPLVKEGLKLYKVL